MFKRKVTPLLAIAMLLMGCGVTPQQATEPAPLVGPVVPEGSPEMRDLAPTTETVPNCGGGDGTIVKHPSMTVLTNHSIEWEVGGQVGVGVTIGEGVVPGGVDLSGALDTHVKNGLDSGIQQSMAWDLPAEPNTVMEYTLMWREVWQSGHLEVRLADQSIVPVNVRYRTGIKSDIIGQRQLNCDGNQIVSPQPTRAIELQPTTRPVSPSPITAVGKCPSTSEQAAGLFGGSPTYWKRLAGYERYAWKYGPAPALPIENFNIPEGMKGDWWDNFKAQSQTGPARVGYASEATIWCAP